LVIFRIVVPQLKELIKNVQLSPVGSRPRACQRGLYTASRKKEASSFSTISLAFLDRFL